jgi:hypothetical protein
MAVTMAAMLVPGLDEKQRTPKKKRRSLRLAWPRWIAVLIAATLVPDLERRSKLILIITSLSVGKGGAQPLVQTNVDVIFN